MNNVDHIKGILYIVGYPKDVGIWQQQSCWYRVIGPGQALAKKGYAVFYASFQEKAVIKKLIREKIVNYIVAHRVAYSEEMQDFLHYAQKYNCRVGIDYDDNIFDPVIADEAFHLLDLPEPSKKIIRNSAYSYIKSLQQVDFAFLSTPELQEKALEHNKNSHCLYNYMPEFYTSYDYRNFPIFKNLPCNTIFYGPGSKEHKIHFDVIKEPLKEILNNWDDSLLIVGGGLDVTEKDGFNKQQIVRLPRLLPSTYMSLLEKCHVAVAPLRLDRFSICKSWIKALEAAYQGTVWVASTTANYKALCDKTEVGFLAADESQWYELIHNSFRNYDALKSQALLKRQYIREHFSWNTNIDKVTELF
ncbi:MAG: glycosyltransferase family 4 protein [Bacteroidetes bacterium]|nr:glycosyltransferase family 4 protein [Bacteroidota bacterium]